MKRWVLIALLASACTKSSGEGAPVVDGSYMVYLVSQPMGADVVEYDVKVSLAKQGNVFEMKIESTEPGETFEPLRVDERLVPENNVIGAYDLGRLWLPPEGRAAGKRTPCGTVSKAQKYRDWDVFRVDGLCGRAQGSRHYEQSTGMLVGFVLGQTSGYLKESG
ncbi:MAG: hypothetical protein RIT81_13495 [Deltaproteobacteria bacterium]